MSIPKVLCLGEIVWDLLPDGRFLGGAPLNVAVHLHRLGVPVNVASAVGDDALGKEVLAQLGSIGLPLEGIEVNNYPTGVVQVDVDAHGFPDYEIRYPAAWDAMECSLAQRAEWSKADYIVIGSLLFRSEVSRERVLHGLKVNRSTSSRLILDVNLRKDGYTPDRVCMLMEMADIVKLNEEELALVWQWAFGVEELCSDVEQCLASIAAHFGLECMLLTLGAEGCCLWSKREGLIRQEAYPVEVVDTVGAGDAFLAGVINGWVKEMESQELLRFGARLGAFVAGKRSATPELDSFDLNL